LWDRSGEESDSKNFPESIGLAELVVAGHSSRAVNQQQQPANRKDLAECNRSRWVLETRSPEFFGCQLMMGI
jgi:hypothetical protein